MAEKDITFDDILELAGEVGVINALSSGQMYALMMKIADPKSEDAQKIYEKLLEIKTEHANIEKVFQKIARKASDEFETSITETLKTSQKKQIEHEQKQVVSEEEKAAEELLETLSK